MGTLKPMRFIAAALLLAATPATAAPAQDADARRYQECLALAESRPTEGWETAIAWTSLGGGEPARHCGAVALIALGKHGEAARRLESLARESRRAPVLRAGLLAQAGQAWLLDNRPEQALAVQTAALSLLPDAPDLLIDRAQTHAEMGHYGEARTDLDRALALAPERPDALVFRATARRLQGDAAGAATDVAAALALAPDHIEARLERGILRRLAGDGAGARADWLRIVAQAPDSVAAGLARVNVERLDVDVGR